jgi:hypothetical protein
MYCRLLRDPCQETCREIIADPSRVPPSSLRLCNEELHHCNYAPRKSTVAALFAE